MAQDFLLDQSPIISPDPGGDDPTLKPWAASVAKFVYWADRTLENVKERFDCTPRVTYHPGLKLADQETVTLVHDIGQAPMHVGLTICSGGDGRLFISEKTKSTVTVKLSTVPPSPLPPDPPQVRVISVVIHQ